VTDSSGLHQESHLAISS